MKENTKLRLKLAYTVITDLIEKGAKVLDLGCGHGNLLANLVKEKQVKGLGIEINQNCVISSIQKGLSVIKEDIDKGLSGFEDKSYDWVILNQTLQSTEKPEYVINEMLRVGKKVIVSFPNFAYWQIMLYLFFTGCMPKSKVLPYEWYNTPNIHLLTINDFYRYCKNKEIKIEKAVFLTNDKVKSNIFTRKLSNFLAEEVIFVIKK